MKFVKPPNMTAISLKSFNTFQVDAPASSLIRIEDEIQLMDVIRSNVDIQLILGGGSNILFSGQPVGIVLKNDIRGMRVMEENDNHVIVETGGGEIWHELVEWAVEKGFGGIENLALIPGTVGAAPIQNIGAYGVELKDVFYTLDAIKMSTGQLHTFDLEACQFAYRDSFFKRNPGAYFIARVRLKLFKKHRLHLTYGAINKTLEEMGVQQPRIEDVSRAVIKIRRSKLPDPKVIGNAGSFFKNPVVSKRQFEELLYQFPNLVYYSMEDGSYKIPAGWLIDQCGFKGKREGNVGCYKNQALVIVNYGYATGVEVLAWANKIADTVYQKYGIRLEKEVNVV